MYAQAFLLDLKIDCHAVKTPKRFCNLTQIIDSLRLTTCLILLHLFVGCASEKTEDLPEHLSTIENLTVYSEYPTPATGIELIREISFGDTDEVFFGRMVENIAVDHSGKVFIADMAENTIHVFDTNGSYIQNFGRSGQGPGEFQAVWDLNIHDGKVHVLDYRNSRISVFDVDTFEHIRDHDVSLHNRRDNQPSWISWTRDKGLFYSPTDLFVRADGKYLLLFSDAGVGSAHNIDGRTYEGSIFDPQTDEFTQHDVVSFEWTGQVLVHEEGGSVMVMFRIPYKRSSLFDYTNDQFVHGWSEEMLFRFHDANGKHQKAFYYSYSNAVLYLDDVLMHFEDAGDDFKHAIRSDDKPETWPAFQSLTLDDQNRLWVSTITEDQDSYKWWVLDESGDLIATFSWPRNYDLKLVKDGYAYTMERDLETGQQEVVRYKINVGI